MTDYYARRDYVYSSGDSTFSIPFSYIDKEHIHVYINEEETENFTFLTDSSVSVSDTLEAGDVVSVRRGTPISSRMVVFTDTSILSKDVQNLDSTQLFDAVQEIYDNNTAFKIDITNQFEDYKDDIDDEISSFETTITTDVSAIENTANTALTNSQSAVSTANSAETKANNAVSTANTANTNASSAVSTANTASTTANTALSTANSAATTASTASTNASTALTNANYAKDKVDEFGATISTVIEAAEDIEELQEAVNTAVGAAEIATAAAEQFTIETIFDGESDNPPSCAAIVDAGFVTSDALPTIDQTYDSTSTNAQSGAAIANAGFLTSITSTNVTNALGYTPVNKAGDTMSAGLTAPSLVVKSSTAQQETTPSSNIYDSVAFKDKNGKDMGYVGTSMSTSNGGNPFIKIQAVRYSSGTAVEWKEIGIGYNSSGDVYTTCPTPASSSNGTNIATTAWVRTKLPTIVYGV